MTSAQIEKIIIHEDYKRMNDYSFDADIAVIILKQTVKYTEYIRPTCLWPGSTSISDIISHKGTIVGWGRDITGVYSNASNKIELPVVTTQTCINSHEDFEYLMSERTFCAGKEDAAGPCNGDSGGPFCLKMNDRWYLRGIVSSSLFQNSSTSCFRHKYLVFTDIAPFLPWIRSFL